VAEQPGSQASPDLVVIDTMIASATLVGPNKDWAVDLLSRYDEYLRGKSFVLSFATVSELRYGSLKGGLGPKRIAQMEEWFRQVAAIVMPDNDLVNICATLRYECQKQAHALSEKIHDSDRWIASTAIRYDVPLVSDDKIFRDVPGLTLLQV